MGLLGAHVSVKDGVDLSPERAGILGCDSMQIFTRNQMQWKARPIGEDEAKKFKQNVKKHRIQRVMAHDSYLINLSAIDKKILDMSKEAFIDEMGRARMLDIDFLVFHPGSHLGAGETKGMKKVSENVRSALLKIGEGKPRVLFEHSRCDPARAGRVTEPPLVHYEPLEDQLQVFLIWIQLVVRPRRELPEGVGVLLKLLFPLWVRRVHFPSTFLSFDSLKPSMTLSPTTMIG